ncbi:hypothetical protein [Nocardiopsis aegyptia]|uniref:Putative membrane protein YeaQ/YmgE (Transglycosylase-associated protein family) n=1 Tax=Nocardiopsis aegyptia TaxID=220378 RepID=A0A7Z0EQ97_9ACTN|nr:hypothetical protein [Nocardiopsis aegyptia]NYJ36314.1 putative membrane protein YeaQ/YmgE (transglycosylase-associated protein family) [Nocardiopsis aegyptia]
MGSGDGHGRDGIGPGTAGSAPPAAAARPSGPLSGALTGLTCAVLLPLGATTGLVGSFGAGWLTRYWDAGAIPQVLAGAGLLAFVALLYGACRLVAWGSRRQSAALAFAAGYLATLVVLVAYLPGGDVVITGHLMHYGYLFGTMLALVIGVVHSGLSRLPSRPSPAR